MCPASPILATPLGERYDARKRRGVPRFNLPRRNSRPDTRASPATGSGNRTPMEAQMRLEMGGSLIVFVWTENQYRKEIVRLFQGINRHLVRLVRARRILGLRFVVIRRMPRTDAAAPDRGTA